MGMNYSVRYIRNLFPSPPSPSRPWSISPPDVKTTQDISSAASSKEPKTNGKLFPPFGKGEKADFQTKFSRDERFWLLRVFSPPENIVLYNKKMNHCFQTCPSLIESCTDLESKSSFLHRSGGGDIPPSPFPSPSPPGASKGRSAFVGREGDRKTSFSLFLYLLPSSSSSIVRGGGLFALQRPSY